MSRVRIQLHYSQNRNEIVTAIIVTRATGKLKKVPAKLRVVCFVHFDGLVRLGRQKNDVNSTCTTLDHSHVLVCLLEQS